jgi:hypothetical protein
MRLHVLQHVPFEGLGSITDWLSARGDVNVTYTRFFEDARLPLVSDLDLIIALEHFKLKYSHMRQTKTGHHLV